MATETVVSDHPAIVPEEVEKSVQSEVKKMEAENVSPPKPEELPCPAAPSVVSEAKVEGKPIEPSPVVEEVKEIIPDEKPKVEAAAPLVECTTEKIEDKPVEPPLPEEVKKTEDVPVVECTVPEPVTANIIEPAIEKPENESKVESVEEKPEEPAKIIDVPEISPPEVVKKAEELPEPAEIVDVPDCSLAAHVEEKAKELPIKGAEESTEAKDVAVLEINCKTEEPVPVVEEKVLEQFEVEKALPLVDVPEKAEKIEELPEPTKIVDVPDCSLAGDVEDKLEELPIKTEPKDLVSEVECKIEKPSELVPAVEEKVPQQIEKALPAVEAGEKVIAIECPDLIEPKKIEEEKTEVEDKEPAKESIQVLERLEVKLVEAEKIKEEKTEVEETKCEETEPAKEAVKVVEPLEEELVEPEKIEVQETNAEEKSFLAEELAQCDEKAIENATSFVPPSEVAEKVAEVEVICEEVAKEPEKIEAIEKTEKVVETTGAKFVEEEKKVDEKIEEVVETAESKCVEEEKKVDEKIGETAQAIEAKVEEEKGVVEKIKETLQDKLDEEKKIIEPIKTEECTEDTKTCEDPPKEDAAVKTQKQSIVKMVKQSLVKAKKAIIGKSHNSKTPAPEAKEEVCK